MNTQLTNFHSYKINANNFETPVYLQFHSFLAFLIILFIQFIAPMLKGLPNDWRNCMIVICYSCSRYFANQVTFPPAFWAAAIFPSAYLSFIIFSSPNKLKIIQLYSDKIMNGVLNLFDNIHIL